jgi:hypothetical protein
MNLAALKATLLGFVAPSSPVSQPIAPDRRPARPNDHYGARLWLKTRGLSAKVVPIRAPADFAELLRLRAEVEQLRAAAIVHCEEIRRLREALKEKAGV